MRLKKIQLYSKFRGLPNDYKIEFNTEKDSSRQVDPICFVGLNGSGKSNVLELISEIFYYLEVVGRSSIDNLESFKTEFGFKIEYILPHISWDSTGTAFDDLKGFTFDDLNNALLISVDKSILELPKLTISSGEKKLLFDSSKSNYLARFLPRYIVGYSSGMNELLSNPFVKMDYNYSQELKAKTNNAEVATLEINRLFYLNYESSKFFSISNFLFDQDSIKPLKEELSLSDLSTFSITLNLSKRKIDLAFLPSELNLALLSFQSIDPFFKKEESSTSLFDRVSYKFKFKINEIKRQAFKEEFKTAQNFFRILYNFQMLNLQLASTQTQKTIIETESSSRDNLSEIIPRLEKEKLFFLIDSIAFKSKRTKEKIYFKQLSDGEHQLLQVVGSIILLNSESTLFLLDEPTTHFNPEWRSKFIFILNKCISMDDLKREQEVILTTHSPFIISDSKRVNVVKTFYRTKRRYENPEEETYGASIRFLLNRLFDQKNSIGEYSFRELEKLSERIEQALNENDIEAIKQESAKFGDSPEKIIMFNNLFKKTKELGIDK